MRLMIMFALLLLAGGLMMTSALGSLLALGAAVWVGMGVGDQHEARFTAWLGVLGMLGGLALLAAELWRRFTG